MLQSADQRFLCALKPLLVCHHVSEVCQRICVFTRVLHPVDFQHPQLPQKLLLRVFVISNMHQSLCHYPKTQSVRNAPSLFVSFSHSEAFLCVEECLLMFTDLVVHPCEILIDNRDLELKFSLLLLGLCGFSKSLQNSSGSEKRCHRIGVVQTINLCSSECKQKSRRIKSLFSSIASSTTSFREYFNGSGVDFQPTLGVQRVAQ
mmetsp:Transcript_45182/g.175346  ORF Transcript_45182/g.175346 Transcript_45182/m.175346 type:complete len:204 (-) Transcript_45182:319-930(-)